MRDTSGTAFHMPRDPVLSGRFLTLSRGSPLSWCAGDRVCGKYFWARNAIFHALRALGIAPGDSVLLPAYICSAAIEPVLAYGAQAEFYEVQRDCTPDLRDLESRIHRRTRAVLFVHYFGFPGPVKQLREICARHRLLLIEDCAHVLSGQFEGEPLGSFGDASVFSWRKFLPLTDGATLVLKQPPRPNWSVQLQGESLLFTLRAAKHILEASVRRSTQLTPEEVPSDEVVQKTNPDPAQEKPPRPGPLGVDYNSAAFEAEMANFPMSRPSRWLFAFSDISAVSAKRKRNYDYLARGLTKLDGVRLVHPELPEGTCPWILPAFFEGVPSAHLQLRAMGIPATTWGGVRIPRITKDLYPSADFLYENLVFLPIHQSLDDADLDEILNAAVKLTCSLSSDATTAPSALRVSTTRDVGQLHE